MAPKYQSDCATIDVEEYDDADDNAVPDFVMHTEAMLDEIDRLVSVLTYLNYSFPGYTSCRSNIVPTGGSRNGRRG